MNERIQGARSFLSNKVPLMLKELYEDTKPAWGSMTALEMIEHLVITLRLSQGEVDVPVVTSKAKHQGIKDFLLSDLEIPKLAVFPIADEELKKWKIVDFPSAKIKLIKEIDLYLDFVSKQPEFVAQHPYAGPMSSLELVVFHKKHFLHHFTQFGLTED